MIVVSAAPGSAAVSAVMRPLCVSHLSDSDQVSVYSEVRIQASRDEEITTRDAEELEDKGRAAPLYLCLISASQHATQPKGFSTFSRKQLQF